MSARSAQEKRAVGRAAAELAEDGMLVGLGTGTTVAELVPALADRHLGITCVATSPATEELARAHGMDVRSFSDIARLDLAIDGADQVDAASWLIKGGGGAQTRERIVAAAADRFVVMVSSDKVVERFHPPVPLELLSFGLAATLASLPGTVLRAMPPSPDGGLIADYHGEIDDPAELARSLDAMAGVISHGLFPPSLVSTVLVARGDDVEARPVG